MDNKWNKISQFKDSSESPGFLLWKTQITWKRLIEKALIAHNLTHSQFVLLASIAYLTKDDNTITQIELSRHALFDISTTSQVVRSLEKNGLVMRTNKTGNIKSKYSKLTELGYNILKPAIKVVESIDSRFFESLNQNELKAFKQITTKLTARKSSL